MSATEPVFKRVFGPDWSRLPPVFKKRYSNRSFRNDIASVKGEMAISFSFPLSWLMPIFKWLHVLAPVRGKQVPVTVDFCSQLNSDGVLLKRKFYFPNLQPYEFNSCMMPVQQNDVIEWMALGLGWRTRYYLDGDKIIMQHKGYVLKLLGYNIPLPLHLIIGKGQAEEVVIDENSYRISMTMTHPWFGTIYSYSGNFVFTRLPT